MVSPLLNRRVMNSEIYEHLRQIVPDENLIKDEAMSRHTTFRTGGPASLFIRVRSVSELLQVRELLDSRGVPFFVIGNGSNLLISDRGYDGAVISLELMNKLKADVVARISSWNKQHHVDYIKYFIYQYYLSCSELHVATLPASQQEEARQGWTKILRPFKCREPWLCPT